MTEAQLLSAKIFDRSTADYVRRASEGESFVITRYGHPIAKLEPMPDIVLRTLESDLAEDR